jgi:hydroxymethylpyrimidine/phosphomethylpyrimidine kinase
MPAAERIGGAERHVASVTSLLAVGGLDPGGGSGLVRDFLTAEALGAHAYLIGTAFTLQTSRAGVVEVEPRSPSVLERDLVAALRAVRPAAVKIGMVATGALAAAIVDGLVGYEGPIVFDPVLAASRGGALYSGDLGELGPLLGRVTVVTPNLTEAGLLSELAVHTRDDARAAAREILREGARAVLVKGGHFEGAADDLLVTTGGEQIFSAPRLPGPSPRGTGCALATAIAVGLGRGEPLEAAIAGAKHWLYGAIAQARTVGDDRHL